jgi:hypothetical protein
VIEVNVTGGGTTLVYVGDLWASAPPPTHSKSDDPQYWQPLVFNDNESPPTIAPLSFVPSFQLSIAA